MGSRTRRRHREAQALRDADRAAWAATVPPDPELEALVTEAESIGYSVTFQRFCEDAETPGLLGRYAGVCIRATRRIKVATNDARLPQLREVLAHELRHARGADHAGDCPELGLSCGGSCKVFDFGPAVPDA